MAPGESSTSTISTPIRGHTYNLRSRSKSPFATRSHRETELSQTPDRDAKLGSSFSSDSEDDATDNIQPILRRSTASKSYTDAEEAAVLRKLDRRLVLFLAFLYLLSFLDRSNIGNARIAGLESSLSMTSKQYDLCLLMFYLTYITFEWMILLYRLVPPHIYISLCVLAWGLVASLQSVVTSFKQLLVLRSLLGITEAAFGPGVPFYMTFFYRREELAYRIGLQISAAPLATSFASSLAWVIVQLARKIGLEEWRALFLVEGFPSIATAVWAWYWIPDSPATARWLSPRERRVASLRVQSEANNHEISREQQRGSSKLKEGMPLATTDIKHRISTRLGRLSSRLHLAEIKETLLDPKSYLTSFMFLSVNVSFASLPVFLPTIINSMSFDPLKSQLLSAPPYLISFLTVLAVGYLSDQTPNSRSIYLCAVATLSAVSYGAIALAALCHKNDVILSERASILLRYIAIYPAAMGLFSSVVLIITWTLNNQQSRTGKGVGMVLLNVVGQCGPLIGVGNFPKRQGPLYVQGMTVCAGFMAVVAVLSLGLRWYLKRLNKLSEEETDGYEMVGIERDDEGQGSGIKDDDDHEEEKAQRQGLISDGQVSRKSRSRRFIYML